MALIVEIKVNDRTILSGHAVRTAGMNPSKDTLCTYRLHDGTVIKHRYGDGALVLAKRILNAIEEPKGRP